jgi:hypothetical protein
MASILLSVATHAPETKMKRLLWIIFHPRETARLLDEREAMIRRMVGEQKNLMDAHQELVKAYMKPRTGEVAGMLDRIHDAQTQALRMGVKKERERQANEQAP